MNPYISLPLTALPTPPLPVSELSYASRPPRRPDHSSHPFPPPLLPPLRCLCIFFLAGTTATKVHHAKKAHLTLSSSGSQAGEGPRTHVQVLANSLCASLLILVNVWRDGVHFSATTGPGSSTSPVTGTDPQASAKAFAVECRGFGTSLILAGIVSNYAAVAADTLSSELGILSSATPVLITSFRKVPRGTNGGVTLWGLFAGLAGGIADWVDVCGTGGFLSFVDPGRGGGMEGRGEGWVGYDSGGGGIGGEYLRQCTGCTFAGDGGG